MNKQRQGIKSDMIQGVELHFPLQFEDERGRVQRMCRIDDPFISYYGMEEIYFSTVYPGVVKAWHMHKIMTLRYVCVYGKVWVGLYDDRHNSKTKGMSTVYFLDDFGEGYMLLVIPPFVWNGFRCAPDWEDRSIVANCASHPHDPDEIVRMKIEDADFDFYWGDYKVSG